MFFVATRIIMIVFSLTKKSFFLTFWQHLIMNLRFIKRLITSHFGEIWFHVPSESFQSFQRSPLKSYWSYPYYLLPFRIVACTFFPTTFLEIAVFSAGHLSWSRGSPLSWDIKSVPVYSVWAQEKLVLAMNRLLEFLASLALFFLEASLFESLAEEDLQGFTQMQKAVKLTNTVARSY